MADGPATNPTASPGESAPPSPSSEPGDLRSHRARWLEYPILVVGVFLIVFVVKTFLVSAYWIPSQSMEPTIMPGDHVLVCRICRHFDDISRGDIIVFQGPARSEPPQSGVVGALHDALRAVGLAPQGTDYIKRVIGLPGDVVELRRGELYVNGEQVAQPYVNTHPRDTSSYGPVTVPDGKLFVLGDNRANSGDSRCSPPACTGLVDVGKVIGPAIFRFWPLPRAGGVV